MKGVVKWVKNPENYIYLILAIVCIAIASRKYDVWILISVIGFVYIVFYLLGKLIFKRKKE